MNTTQTTAEAERKEKLTNLAREMFSSEDTKQTILDNVFFKLLPLTEMNESRVFDDCFPGWLCKAFCIMLECGEDSADIILTWNIMEDFDITIDEVIENANKNTPVFFRASIKTMDEMLCELSGDDFFPFGKEASHMYIVSNTQGMFGASVMCYEGILEELAEKIGTSFYVLPSSRHEVICLSARLGPTSTELKEMVREVNETMVSSQDLLSYDIYFYSIVDKTLQVVA